MTDTFGALPIPTTAPGTGEAAGDPALNAIAAFLAASVNRACVTAWQAVCPGTSPAQHIFTNDPATQFDESRLPALYLWRTGGTTERATDGELRDTSDLALWWVCEPGSNYDLVAREPMVAAVGKALAAAILRGRDPGWIVEGDTDPLADDYGSFVLAQAGVDSLRAAGRWAPLGKAVDFVDADGRQVPMPGLTMQLTVVESLVRDPTIGTYPSAVDQTGMQGDDAEEGAFEVEFLEPVE